VNESGCAREFRFGEMCQLCDETYYGFIDIFRVLSGTPSLTAFIDRDRKTIRSIEKRSSFVNRCRGLPQIPQNALLGKEE